jgi:NADPH-dependent glutamate synthase beta subunit-like oxidoreductase
VRKSFADGPVRIAELESWVCREAGERGWTSDQPEPAGRSAAIIGAGPAGLSCAYFLARAGWKVELLDARAEPGGSLLDVGPAVLPEDARDRDIKGVLASGVAFVGGRPVSDVDELARSNDAVFLAAGADRAGLLDGCEPAEGGLMARGKLIAGGSIVRGACSAVQAVADGRAAAVLMHNRPAGSART